MKQIITKTQATSPEPEREQQMKTRSVIQRGGWSHSALAAVMALAVAALATSSAFARMGTQLEYFFYNDGTQVVSDNGEPDDGVLIRFYDTQRNRIVWQLMTQHLTPGVRYDIWLEGSNDGTEAGAFNWWVGSAKATPQGEINVTGTVYVGVPPGTYTGSFTNSRAQVNLVIKTTSGDTVQTAFFPAF